MKLYSMVPQDCSGKVRWLLNEMGLPFEEIKVSYRNGDLKTPEYLAKHPLGQVPVLEDGTVTLFESYAIVAYLADKYPEKGMAPSPKDAAKRAEYYQWLFFTTGSAESFFGKIQKLSMMPEEYQKEWGDYTRDKVQKVMMTIEKRVTDQDYILGDFSAVDTCLGYALDGVCDQSFFHDYPKTKAYYERLSQREACLKSEIFKRN